MLDALSDDMELIAPCGMNCSVCSSYLARKYELRRQGVKMPYCAGCRPRDKKCAFLKKRCDLLINRKVRFCFECTSFPCRNLEQIDARYQKHYRTSLIENLTFIEQHSLAAFVERENAKWQCMQCRAALCCHNGICYNCSIDRLQTRKKWYRWEDDQ
ncbi:MAG: DUF3795 domain-containing protein [Halobacteriota archaeon]|jgi:hypothetical protein